MLERVKNCLLVKNYVMTTASGIRGMANMITAFKMENLLVINVMWKKYMTVELLWQRVAC